MNNQVTFIQLTQRLEENRLKYEVLEFNNGAKLVISERGGGESLALL